MEKLFRILILLSTLYCFGQGVAMHVLTADPGALGATTQNAVDSTVLHHGTYDVTSYGAKCDGWTSDTAAIQSAISAAASGGTIILPAATCVVSPSSADYILSLGGGNVTIRGAGTGASVL